MAGLRGGLAWVAVGCVMLAGCTQTMKAAPPATLDISRIAQIDIALPPGFAPDPTPATVKPVQPQWADSVGVLASVVRPFTVQPGECRPLLQPVDARQGADSIGIRNDGPQNQGISLLAYNPVTVTAEMPSAGCDHMTYAVDDDAVPTSGTVERIAAPAIDGATTVALKINVTGSPSDEYYYAAILERRALVEVTARVDKTVQAQPLLPDLLVSAVSAVRGR